MTKKLLGPKVLKKFYEEFKDKPPEAVKKISFEQGVKVGNALLQQMDVKGDDLARIQALLRVIAANEPTVEIEISNNKTYLRNKGFCPFMTACLALNLPWDWFCPNFGWPFFHGLGAAVNPNTELKVIKWRYKGDPYCDHVYEIKQN